jgi:hypothetical protein
LRRVEAMPAFQKRLLTLSITIGVLVGAYVLGLIFSPASVRRRELETSLVPSFEAEKVAEIRLSGSDGSINIEKRGDAWIVPAAQEEYPASVSRIEALLDFVQTIKRSRLVTSNPDAWSDFQVDSSASQRIQFLDAAENVILSLIVGKVDEARGGSYVRLENSNEVVLVNRLFDYYLNTTARFWSYLKMFPEELSGTDFNRISVRSSGGFPDEAAAALSYTLLLGEGRERDWKLLDSAAADTTVDNAKVDRLANNLASLEGADFAARIDAESAGLSDPIAEILASTSDGRDFRLLIGAPAGEERYYGTLEGSKYIYELAVFRLENLFRPLSELRPDQGEGQQ